MPKKRSTTKRPAKSMTPYLTVHDAAAAIEFYKAAFSAREVARTDEPETGRINNAELKVCGGSLYICDEFPEFGILSPLSAAGAGSMLDLRVGDVDALWQKALDAGALEVSPIGNVPWGGRSGKLVDPFGHYWSISGEAVTQDSAGDVADLMPVSCAHVEAIAAAV